MPVGAVIGGAVIAGGGAVAAGALGAGAQKDAAHTAADTAAANAAANNALQREIYGENAARLDPFAANGLAASNALSGLLLGGRSAVNPATPTPAPSTSGTGTGGALSHYSGPGLGSFHSQGDVDAYLGYYQAHPDQDPGFTSVAPFHGDPWRDESSASAVLAARNGWLASHPNGTPAPAPTPAPTPTPAAGGSGGNGALDAWDQFRQGTNYQWRLGQGESALNSKYAGNGAFDSGAADKAAITFGQNFASNELSNYMNLLASQQAMGLSAAGAVAGVGTTYAGNVAAQNTAAANAAANAALASGNASAGMYGAIGNTAGQLGGALFQYGMGQQQPQMNWGQAYNAAASQPLPTNIDQGSLYIPGGF